MSLRDLRFDQVNEAALQSLVDNQVRESLTLDFKETLPDKSDKGKREFLKDVTAFSNAEGGDLLFGVEEDDGVASDLPGVAPASLDTEVQRLASLLRDGVDLRLHGVNIQAVSLSSGTNVLHVRVPRSLEAPHMVRLGRHRQFYTRNPSGNHPMSTTEIRTTVLRTSDWRGRAERFRQDRVRVVEAGSGPVHLSGTGRLHVHIVPMPLQDSGIDLTTRQARDELQMVAPRGAGGWNPRLTFDGLLVCTNPPGSPEPNVWYRLWFHDGTVEFVLSGLAEVNEQSGGTFVRGGRVEARLEEAVRQAMTTKINGAASTPALVFVTLTGVNGATLTSQGVMWDDALFASPIDRDALMIPPVFLEERPDDYWVALSPAINRLWQSAGRAGSPWLNSDGTRRQQR